MKTVAIMSETDNKNLFPIELADTVSDETSTVYAFLTGLISKLRNCQKIFEIDGMRFSVNVDSEGEVTIKSLNKEKSKPSKSIREQK